MEHTRQFTGVNYVFCTVNPSCTASVVDLTTRRRHNHKITVSRVIPIEMEKSYSRWNTYRHRLIADRLFSQTNFLIYLYGHHTLRCRCGSDGSSKRLYWFFQCKSYCSYLLVITHVITIKIDEMFFYNYFCFKMYSFD